MKKFVFAVFLALGSMLSTALPALADTMPMPAPGPDFGSCVAMMAQGGMMAGAAFGQCVSAMAHGLCGC